MQNTPMEMADMAWSVYCQSELHRSKPELLLSIFEINYCNQCTVEMYF